MAKLPGHLRCSVCHGSKIYKHPTSPTEIREEGGLGRSEQKKEDGGLFTAGEGGRGRGGWEQSDQLHADLRKKRLPGERERKRDK